MKFTEIRTIGASDIRKLCIKNDQYAHLQLDLCEWKDNLTTEDIVEIAEDIIAHSEIEADGRTKAEVIESVAFEVMRVCNNFITVKEG